MVGGRGWIYNLQLKRLLTDMHELGDGSGQDRSNRSEEVELLY